MNHTIDPGEVLVIYNVQRDRKVLARDFKGRELCLSKRNWRVKVISDINQQEYDTLVNVPSRYFRVLHDIRSFRLFAGDILLFMKDPPHLPNARNLRCCLVSCTDQVCLDLPAKLNGTFQALPNYGMISMERVLTECSLPVKISLEHERQNGIFHCAEEETTSIINVQIDREIEEDTVFAISPSKNSILVFPKSLNIAVAQLMPQHEFVSSRGLEYTQVLRTIENDQVLQNAIRGNSVYYTSEPIRCYRFKKLLFPSFGAEKEDKRVEEGIEEELIPEASSESPPPRQKAVFTSESNQPCSFSEKSVPPLPAKTKNSTVKQYQFTTKNNEVQQTESQQESEKQENSKQARSTQEVSHNLGFLVQHKSHTSTWAATTGTSTPAPREKKQMNLSRREKLETESDDNVFSACEPQCGVNANSVTVNSGTLSVTLRKGTLGNHLEPKRLLCNKPCWLAEANTTEQTKSTIKGKESSTMKHSDSPFEQRESDEGSETQLTQDLFVSTQSDFSPTWQAKSFSSCSKAHQKEFKVIKCSESSAELSEEDNEDSDCNDFSILEKQEAFKQNIPERNEDQSKPVDRLYQGDLEAGNMKMYRTNEDNTKKSLFHSLTRRPRWFRLETGKPGKKEKRQESSKSEAVRISPRNAASCESLWISSPKEDDFECISSITKYLETKEKLTRALVTINSLEMKGLESADTMTDNTNEYLQGKPVSDEDRKVSKMKENIAKPDKNPEESHDISTQTTDVQSPTIFSRDISSEETSGSLIPATHYPQLKCESLTFNGNNPDYSSEAKEGIPYNLCGCSTSCEDFDSYMLMLPSFGSDRHMEWHRKDRGVEHGADEQETCSCTRNLGVFGGELSESTAKRELKKAILKLKWTEEEWAELTDAVRCNGRKRAFPPYANFLCNGSNRCISKDQIFIDTSRTPNWSMRRAMPPYMNIPKPEGIQGVNQQTGQGFVNDVQRLANLSLGKPPIPTPRSGRSSV